MSPSRRRLLAAPLLLAGSSAWWVRAQSEPLRVSIDVQKFAFDPARITARRGQALTLSLTTNDFVHGFAVPDFKVRVDVVPGKPTTVSFTPDRAGEFHFLCDNFCGEGHDQMSGFLVVKG